MERLKEAISLPAGEADFNDLLDNYQRAAKSRGRDFLLTREEARVLFKGNCAYCGAEPVQIQALNKQKTRNGDFLYNGIDRVDNSIGYTVENCVPCCSACNIAKGKRSAADFIDHSFRIAEFRKSSLKQ